MSKFYINALIAGQEIEITKVRAFKSLDKQTLIGITDTGHVYYLGSESSHGIDLVDSWRSNDALRRAWCKLTGHKMSEIRAEQRKQKEESAKGMRDRNERQMRRIAGELGFKVTKIRGSRRGT